jgi:hypothetical protein
MFFFYIKYAPFSSFTKTWGYMFKKQNVYNCDGKLFLKNEKMLMIKVYNLYKFKTFHNM